MIMLFFEKVVAPVLDFRVETFLCVCRYMSFTAAAEALHITQPAVSQHIRYLESAYGVRLFDREGKKVRLTPAGALLRRTMMTVQNDQQAMLRRMREAGSGRRTLSFGVTLTIGEYGMVHSLARFLKSHPDTDIRVRFGNTHDLLERLRRGAIDFALVEGYFASEEFDTMVDRTEPYIPVCAAGHRFRQEVQVLTDLLGERLLVRESGSGTREILEKNLAVRNLRLTDFAHLAEVENMHTIVSLLRMDCGIAFLYRAAVAQGLRDGTLRQIPLEDFQMQHDFTFLWNRGSSFSREYREICGQLRSCPENFQSQDLTEPL
ncbi:LysR family transcriptional regulator [uncultured Oscillibacter sp.]|uniref:LysR family transcriptional regulator n=1 Tax=uncultured Oscillibacter sp. TaxID=876091 RepID=UPI003453A408